MALRPRLSPGLPLSDVVLHSYYSTFQQVFTLQRTIRMSRIIAEALPENKQPIDGRFPGAKRGALFIAGIYAEKGYACENLGVYSFAATVG